MSTLTLAKSAPAPITPEDLAVAAAWQLTPAEWTAATDRQRVAYRDRVAFALASKAARDSGS
jgi:hypothetical protein